MIKQDYASRMAEKGMRIDNRGLEDYREITVEQDIIKSAEGSARAKIGKTEVICGVKMEVGEPYSDKPNEGVLRVTSEFSPFADPEFHPGPPSEKSVELSRVVDRGIRESGMIDTKKLFIKDGKVWMVCVDLNIMDNFGNLTDAAALAAVAALLDTKMPKYEDGKIIVEEKIGPLPVEEKPVTITCIKLNGQIFVDPCLEEENEAHAKLSIGLKEDGNIVSMQKSGSESLTVEEIEKIIELAKKNSKEIREKFLKT